MRRFRRGISTGAALTLLVLSTSLDGAAAAPPPQAAARVTCGETITENTTLVADVGPCPGDGIIIGADNITLNLNGHTVSGTPGPGDGFAAGIRIVDRTGVTVTGQPGQSGRRGTVTGFDGGIAVYRGSGHTIQNLEVRDNIGPDRADVELGDGIGLFNSANNRVIDNLVAHNGFYDGIAALGPGTDNNLFENNVVEGNVGSEIRSRPGHGIVISNFFQLGDPRRGESVYDNRIINNVFRKNYRGGVSTISSVRGQIIGNLVEENGDRRRFLSNGIGITRGEAARSSSETLIQGNRVLRNGQLGIVVGRRIEEATVTENEVIGHLDGILANLDARNNVITSNTVLESFFEDLFDFSDAENDFASCPNVWRDNVYETAFPDCIYEMNPPTASSPAVETAPAAPGPPDHSRSRLLEVQDEPPGQGRGRGRAQ